ncbi:MAG: hypothetical protein LBU67_08190 [Oscillospiraceae bacterium]|nr:hypothetical protein [Oscillospiraceae bacterium]
MVRVRLRTLDGSKVPDQELASYGDEFLLMDGAGEQRRPFQYETNASRESDAIELVFYCNGNPQVFDDAQFSVAVSPAAAASDELMGTELVWHGHTLGITRCTDDKATLSGYYPWPEQGYLVRVTFKTLDESLIAEDEIAQYANEIALVDDERVYRHVVQAVSQQDSDSFGLIYLVDGEPFPTFGSLKLALRPRGALWADAAFRQTDGEVFERFIPKTPQANTYALALADQSMYKPNEGNAITHPEEAFMALEDELEDLSVSLREMFAGEPFALVGDPDHAFVLLTVDATYPLAGTYGVGGVIRAYNCYLTLTAYDALTHQEIAKLQVGSYFGDTISVTPGTSVTWKRLPNPADAEGGDAFVKTLVGYGRDWVSPQ